MPESPPVALTIAGVDSGGGAGVAADLKTFAAHGVFGTLAVTAVTAQDTTGVKAVEALSPELVAEQISVVIGDLSPRAAKTGMLATPAIVELVTALAVDHSLPPLVVDPVLVASSGDPLFEGTDTAQSYRALVAAATVVTPNLPEASILVGREILDLSSTEQAAVELHELGAGLVVIKGGHRPGPEAVDVVYDGRAITHLRGSWVRTRNVHGTGCSFAAAIAANLALGADPLVAAQRANEYVHKAVEGAKDWQLGAGHGPIDHFGWGR